MKTYQREVETAKRLLNKFGRKGYVKIVRGQELVDPVNGTVDSNQEEIDILAVDLNVKRSLIGSAGNTGDKTEIMTTDRMIICDNEVEPLDSDSIKIGDRSFKIIDIMPVSPAGLAIYYKVICRG